MAVCSRLLVRPDRVPRAGAGRVVVSSAELCKALVRESFKFGQQIANSSSAALMQVVNNDQYYASRRNRIHRGPETQLVKRSVRRSRFAAMLVGPGSSSDDEPAADERRQVSFDPAADGAGGERAGTAGSDAVSDTTAATVRNIGEIVLGAGRQLGAWLVQRLVSLLHLLLMWLPGMGSRAERLAKMLGPERATTVEWELEHTHTGLLEDAQTRILLAIEWCCWMVRRVLYATLGDGRAYSQAPRDQEDFLTSHLSMRNRFRRDAASGRRTHNLRASVAQSGYPFEQIMVTTADGYCLELHRLPRPNSDRVMFLQHGIMDSSYSFIAKGASDGLAFRAFDKGYDVFMGNFRGTSSLKHSSDHISARAYWDFTLDDHGNRDLEAFILEIQRIKSKDLAAPPPRARAASAPASGQPDPHGDATAGVNGPASETVVLDTTLVAHSMGAAAALIYVVNKCRAGQAHHLNRMVLMSPAGYHQRIPRLCRVLGPLIDKLLASTVYTLSIPSARARSLSTKLMRDAVSLPAIRDLVYSFGEMFLGGDFRSTVHPHINVATDNVIAGTSSKVFKQFWNSYLKGRFLSFDYGPEGNLRHYGTQTPVDYMAHYNLIDVPIHFMAGLNDNLIPAKDTFKHYKALHRASPSLATCKPLAGRGHLDFTYGLDQEIAGDIFAHAAPHAPAAPPARLGSPRGKGGSPHAGAAPPLWPPAVGKAASADAAKAPSPRNSLRRESTARSSSSLEGGVGVVLGHALRVAELTPGGPAARAMVLRVGDEVLSVGGTVVVGQAPAAVQEQMRGAPGTDVTVGFRRSGAHKKATLQRDVHF